MYKEAVLSIDLDQPTPAYRQIADGLRALLVAGEGPAPGEHLQPVRRLAADLGVHHNTVAQAYRLLADEGWLELVRGRGAVVRRRARPKPDDGARQAFERRLEALVSEAVAGGLPRRWVAAALRRRAGSTAGEGRES